MSDTISPLQNPNPSLLQSPQAPRISGTENSEELQEVAQEFESLFVKMLLDSMLETRNQEHNLSYGGQAEDIFEDMLYTEYSRIIAKQGNFGIADAIIDQLSNRTGN